MIDPCVLPPSAVEHARAFLDGSSHDVAKVPTPRLAAATVLVRGGTPGRAGSVEVFLQRRHAAMAFAASAVVFPGGGVDERDLNAALGWAGPTPGEWALTLGLTVPEATAVVCAAIRELFEEAGVLLAGPDAGSVVADLSAARWERDRAALESRELSMSRFLRDRGLVLRTDLLALWRVWLTPEFEPRRYRTHFFVALLPPGQAGRTASGESEDSVWMTMSEVLSGAGSRHLLLPPQICTCAELLPFFSAEEVLESARRHRRAPIAPEAVLRDDEVRLDLPGELLELVEAAAAELAS